MQRPAKAMPVQQIMIWALQCQHDLDVHLLFCVYLDLHITSSIGRVQLGLFSSILTDGYHFACSAQQKLCLFNNYHAQIALPTWNRCAPPILFWPWPPYNWSCLTWILFRWSSLMGTTLCAALSKSYAFSTNYYALHCINQHDVDVHLLFCFDLDLHLACSQGHV